MADQLRDEWDEQMPQEAVVQQPDDGENDMSIQILDNHHVECGNGNVDKGPRIEEPAALTDVVDAAVDMVRRYKDKIDMLEDVKKKLESYFVDQRMDHFEDDEMRPIRDLIVKTKQHFNREMHNDPQIHDSIHDILNSFYGVVCKVIGGCAVAVVEYNGNAPFSSRLVTLCHLVRKILLEKVLTEEKIKAALAQLKDPLSDEASIQVLEIFREVKEKFLRVQISFQSKSLLSCLRKKSSTLELTFMTAFPYKSEDEKKELELVKKFTKRFEGFPHEYHELYDRIVQSFTEKENRREDSKITLEDMKKEIPDPHTIRQRLYQRQLNKEELEYQESSKRYKAKEKKELKKVTEKESLIKQFKDTELGDRKDQKQQKGADKSPSEEEEQMGASSSQEEQAAGEQSKSGQKEKSQDSRLAK